MKKIFGLFFILKFLLNPILANENLNIPNVFSSGGTISSSQMNSNFNYLLQKIETLQNLIASNSVTSNTPSLIATGSSGTFLGSSDGDNWFVWKSEGSGIDYSSSSFEANGKFFNSSQFYTTDFKNFLKVESFNIPKPETSSNTSYWGNLGYLGGKYYYWISNGRELYESLDLVNWTFLNLDTNNQWYSKVIFEGELIFSISNNNGRYSYTKINDTSQSTEIHISEICCSRIIDIEFFNGNYYLISSKRVNVSGYERERVVIFKSSDGINWTENYNSVHNLTQSDTALNITSAENMLIVKSGYSLLSSNDEGATWKRFETYADTMGAGSSSQKPSLIYFNNYYYFITQELADNQYSGKGLGIFRTSDGTVWQNVYKNSDQINNIFKFDKIYAVGDNGLLAYSSDGINWTTKRPTGNSLYQIFDVSD